MRPTKGVKQMANIYSRVTKLKNIKGRSDYISNPNRQDDIVLHQKNMRYTWDDYVSFELAHQKSSEPNNQGRELVVALPNEAAQDVAQLKRLCDTLSVGILGNQRDYEYAVHWNEAHTNLHLHLIFSERQYQTEVIPKRYKRDYWYDKKTNRITKAGLPGSELRYKKGDIQRDKEGQIKYETEVFSTKRSYFTSKDWLVTHKKQIQEVYSQFGYEVGVYAPGKEIAQKKLFKGASEDYLSYVRDFNVKANRLNREQRVLEEIERDMSVCSAAEEVIYKQGSTITIEKIKKQSFLDKLFSNKKIVKLEKEYELAKEKQKERLKRLAKKMGRGLEEYFDIHTLLNMLRTYYYERRNKFIKEKENLLNQNSFRKYKKETRKELSEESPILIIRNPSPSKARNRNQQRKGYDRGLSR